MQLLAPSSLRFVGRHTPRGEVTMAMNAQGDRGPAPMTQLAGRRRWLRQCVRRCAYLLACVCGYSLRSRVRVAQDFPGGHRPRGIAFDGANIWVASRLLLALLVAASLGCGSETDSSTSCYTTNRVVDGKVVGSVQECCTDSCTYHSDGTTDCTYSCTCTITGTADVVTCG